MYCAWCCVIGFYYFRVEAVLLDMNWRRITDKYDNFFRLKWVDSKSQINYNAFREGSVEDCVLAHHV